jgi:hypothetical protein
MIRRRRVSSVVASGGNVDIGRLGELIAAAAPRPSTA